MNIQHIAIHIDQVAVDAELSHAEAARLQPTLQAAFEQLALRLQATPISRQGNPARLILNEVSVEPIAIDELLGPRGAARLAEAFWQRITS